MWFLQNLGLSMLLVFQLYTAMWPGSKSLSKRCGIYVNILFLSCTVVVLNKKKNSIFIMRMALYKY